MASSIIPLVQRVVSSLGVENITTQAVNGTSTSSQLGSGSPLSILMSMAALGDWLKLLIIGGFLETCRRSLSAWYQNFIDAFFITANFRDDDSSYDWMMVWLSRHGSWAQARNLQISTQSFGLDYSAVMVPGEEDDVNSLLNGSRKLAYLPSVSTTQSIRYKGRWMSITRGTADSGYYGRRQDTLEISIMTRHHRILNELLLEAKKAYMTAQSSKISIYVSDSSNNWRHVASRPKRPLRSIVLDPGIKDLLIDDARDFLESKAWYAARGIPFRRGYLLYGAPGSGKTSIIHSLAGELGLDVYIISLSRSGLDDTGLSELTSELPEKCIALMEDIDAAFTTSLNRDAPASQPTSPTSPTSPAVPPPKEGKGVSLSGLLNALDGVGAQEGRILFATTNKYNSLDPALSRPGRMDIHVEFKLASKYQAGELYLCFYLPTEDISEGADQGAGGEVDEKESVDSGYGSGESVDSLETSSEISEPPSPITHPAPPSSSEQLLRINRPHRERAAQLSRSRILSLSHQFSDAIPDREFSMASLQGYLMGYKTRPLEAVKNAPGWAAKELLQRASVASNLNA